MLGSLIFAIVVAPIFADLIMRRRKAWAKQQTNNNDSDMAKEPIIVRAILVVYRPLVSWFVRRRWAAVVLSVVMLLSRGIDRATTR